MEKQYIWYNSTKVEYACGNWEEYKNNYQNTNDDIILAEEFEDMPVQFVQKITHSLNQTLLEKIRLSA